MTELGPHIESLRRYARYLARDPDRAEDLLQDTIVSAISGLHTLRPGAPLRPWLFRIMYVNHLAGWRRRERSPVGLATDELPDVPVAPAQEGTVELAGVLRALDMLPEPQRDAIALIALEDMSYAEAAAVLGIPVGTLMSRLSRGRASLRRAVSDEAPVPLRVVAGKDS